MLANKSNLVLRIIYWSCLQCEIHTLAFNTFNSTQALANAMSDPTIPAVLDFSAVFDEAYASHKTPAGLVETLMPNVLKYLG